MRSPGFAARAAKALRKARSAVWRSDAGAAEAAPERQVVSFADLTDRLKLYMSSGDIQKVKAAFRFADEAHLGQFRKSGEPYITHPIAVAEILAHCAWKLDARCSWRRCCTT